MSAASNEWFYIDDDGNEQGPYSFDNVCTWFKDAYFDTSTLLRHKSASDATKLGDLPEFDHLLESKLDDNADDKADDDNDDDGDDADENAPPTTAHEPLKLDGVAIAPPPGWNGEPIVSNAAAVLQATQEIADALKAIEEQQEQQATAKWSDAEFEHWSLMAQRMIATPQLLPAAVWQRLEVERRERHRIAAMAAKFMKDHQIKGIKRKKYSWSSGFKGI